MKLRTCIYYNKIYRKLTSKAIRTDVQMKDEVTVEKFSVKCS